MVRGPYDTEKCVDMFLYLSVNRGRQPSLAN